MRLYLYYFGGSENMHLRTLSSLSLPMHTLIPMLDHTLILTTVGGELLMSTHTKMVELQCVRMYWLRSITRVCPLSSRADPLPCIG